MYSTVRSAVNCPHVKILGDFPLLRCPRGDISLSWPDRAVEHCRCPCRNRRVALSLRRGPPCRPLPEYALSASNPLLESAALVALAPYTVAGYALFREIVETDGAVAARFKGLFAAAAAVNKGHRELARRELERARAQGLPADEAASALILLASLRGEATALAFGAILDAVYGPREAAPAAPVAAAPGEAEANFKAYFGTVPAPLANLLALVPRGADGYYLMRKGTIDCNRLPRKLSELMLIAVLAADYSPMSATHVKGARVAGASEAEIAEAILCAVPAAGIAAWMSAGALLE
ncbi:MAG: carboxymuconolactone decarboxylase family protein, partial [Burkholderiales bacterium]|nr:carboxymuconolactone decarboxylase family protein [Burkholderiales bacterium]